MNKDDMHDDAEFEAFLKGEGALARQLQSLPQPESPTALDAAILQNARAAPDMAPRAAAANDAGDNPPASMRPPGLSWRWRIPAGIAATLLVGVIARQSFEADRSVPAYETTVAPAPAADVPELQAPTAEAAAAPPPPPEATQDIARKPAPSAPVMRGSPPAARAAKVEPAPDVEMIESAPAPQPVSATGRRATLDRYSAADEGAQAQYQAEAERQQREAARSRTLEFSRSASAPAPAMAAAPPPPPAAAPALLPSGAEMLQRIESLLESGREREALAAWERLRQAYPDFPVPDTTREKLRQIQ